MAELFDDRPKTSTGSSLFSKKKVEPPKSEQPASMEQLEQDLKSILSEISQLGSKDREATTLAWNNHKAGTTSGRPAVKKESGGSSPTSPTSAAGQMKEPPKFCHSCGSPYPEHLTVKFCCQCGSRRLFV